MAIRTAVLLAAGRGTRLGTLTTDTPKPLLEVAGVPLIEHIVGGLIDAGMRDFVIVTGYLGEKIERWSTDFAAANAGIAIRTSRQKLLNGTAGAMVAAREYVAAEEYFIFGWGDILMDRGNYPRFVEVSRRLDYDLLLAVNDLDDPWRGAAVYVDSELRVRRLVEKPPRGTSSTRWNSAGLFATSARVFEYIERLRPSSRGELELPQAIESMLADGKQVRAVAMSGFWSDVGTPEDLAKARAQFPKR